MNPAPAAPLTGTAGSLRPTPQDSHSKPVVADSSPQTPRVERGRRSSVGGTPQNVTPLATPNPAERVTPLQGQATPSTPFSAHVGRPVHTAPRITGLSPEPAQEGRGRSLAVDGDSPYLQRARSARSSEPAPGRLRSSEPADSPQLPDFVSPTGHVPRPNQERRPRAQRSRDAGRHGSEPLPDKRTQRKSLPAPAGRLDPLWDQLAATIAALPGIAPQSTDQLSRALKHGADRKSLRASFDSMLREILVPRAAAAAPPPSRHAEQAEHTGHPDTANSGLISSALLPWPASPPLEAQSPDASPLASPESPALTADPARENTRQEITPSPEPRSPLISPESHDFARHRFHSLKRGPFWRPPEPEPQPFSSGRSAPGQGRETESEEDSEHESANRTASVAISPGVEKNVISAMSAPIVGVRLLGSGKQSSGNSGSSSPGFAAAGPLPAEPRAMASSPATHHARSRIQRHLSSGARSTRVPKPQLQVSFAPDLGPSASPLSPKSPPVGSVHRAGNSSVLRLSVSPGTPRSPAPRSPLVSPEARRSPAVRRSSSPEMAGFRQDHAVAMLGHWKGLMNALKLNSAFRQQAVAQAVSAFSTLLESRTSTPAALNAGFDQLLEAIKRSHPGFPGTPQRTPLHREPGSPACDARADTEGRFSGIQDGNLGLHLRKLAAEIESLANRPHQENRADFRSAAQALIQWINNQ